jgi:hypothetical protein
MNIFEKARLEGALSQGADCAGLWLCKAEESLVRVMTTNISAAGDRDAQRNLEQVYGLTWADRVDIQAAAILDYRPDFVGLQEIQRGTVNGVDADMHAQLMKRLGEEYTQVDMDAFVPLREKQWTPILYRHAQWCEGIAEAFKLLCVGDNEGFDKTLREFILDFGQHEFEFERYFDLGLAAHSLTSLKVLPAVEVD